VANFKPLLSRMAPSAVEPEAIQELTSKGVARIIDSTAPSIVKDVKPIATLDELDASKLIFIPNPHPRAIPAPGTAEAAKKLCVLFPLSLSPNFHSH
jgi:hypothetical protein